MEIGYIQMAIVIVVSILIGFLLRPFVRKITILVVNKNHLIKNYWLFSVLFLFVTVIAYFLVFKYTPVMYLNSVLGVIATVLPLVFAIFVGYFAFAAVVENRLDKFKSRGDQYIAARDYIRAIQQYEQACKIDYKNPEILMNLLEAYIIEKNVSKFQEILPMLERFVYDGKEKLIVYYLSTSKELLTQNLARAKEKLRDCIKYIETNPESLARFSWNFSDITSKGYYLELGPSDDSKIILDNFIRYLNKSLTPEEKLQFETGNYKLIQINES